ncbi:hypothetical protein C1T28_03345 [Bacillus subtilis]|nr:hypothetical protein C1T25_10665 [Bacillus cereus]POO76220.1 hypothetical protein C1T28_03345 [Bacillus subtilis]
MAFLCGGVKDGLSGATGDIILLEEIPRGTRYGFDMGEKGIYQGKNKNVRRIIYLIGKMKERRSV